MAISFVILNLEGKISSKWPKAKLLLKRKNGKRRKTDAWGILDQRFKELKKKSTLTTKKVLPAADI